MEAPGGKGGIWAPLGRRTICWCQTSGRRPPGGGASHHQAAPHLGAARPGGWGAHSARLCAALRAAHHRLCAHLCARLCAALWFVRAAARCMCGCGVWVGVCAHASTVWAQLRPLLTFLHAAPPVPDWTLRALRRVSSRRGIAWLGSGFSKI